MFDFTKEYKMQAVLIYLQRSELLNKKSMKFCLFHFYLLGDSSRMLKHRVCLISTSLLTISGIIGCGENVELTFRVSHFFTYHYNIIIFVYYWSKVSKFT